MSFYEGFKKIRNKLKSYSKEDIFNTCMDALRQVWGLHLLDVYQQNLAAPMHALSLLKWGLIYGEHPRNARKVFGSNEFLQLHYELSQLSTLTALLADNDPLAVHKITRAIMSHQMNYQNKSGLHGLALFEILFGKIGLDYDFDKTMNRICGLSVQEFITLQLIMLESMVMNNKHQVYEFSYFKYLFEEYGEEKISKFLHFNSCDFQELEKFLAYDHKRIGNPEYEHAALSSLYKKPLYRIHNRFVPYHKALIEGSIEYGIYDILKEADAEHFCSPFGVAFEEYISIALQNAGTNPKREREIRRYAHRDSVCDFIIEEGNSTIFLEAKSAEMHYLTRQNPQIAYLKTTLQNSLISGYRQIITLVHALKQRKDTMVDHKEVFGIIITFKELLLGHPQEIWLEFMKSFMETNLDRDTYENLPIDPEKIFVISAYDLDHLLAYARKNHKSVSECLKMAYDRNRSAERTFFFHDNFDDDSIKVLESPHLWESYKRVTARIEEALKKGQGITV